jgi:hypothetical protein
MMRCFTGPSARPALPIRVFALIAIFFAFLMPTLLAPATVARAQGQTPAPAARLRSSQFRPPLAFEPNQGQAPPAVRYLCRGAGATLYLAGNEAVLALARPGRPPRRPGTEDTPAEGTSPPSPAVVRLRFLSSAAGTSGQDNPLPASPAGE